MSHRLKHGKNNHPKTATTPLLVRGGAAQESSLHDKQLEVEGTNSPSDGSSKSTNTSFVDRLKQILFTQYKPDHTALSFMSRIQEKKSDNGDVKVKVAVLGATESHHFFGASMAKYGIQPCYIEVDNSQGDCAFFFDRLQLDPNYYPPLEAAMVCHFANLKSLLTQGFLSWLVFLPLATLLPFKLITARGANRAINEYFCSQSFPNGLIEAGTIVKGFVFTSLDIGTKQCNIGLLKASPDDDAGTLSDVMNFAFSCEIPRLAKIDYDRIQEPETIVRKENIVECTEDGLKERLEMEPRAVLNARGTKEGDPVNLVVVGNFSTILAAFGPRWDETEITGLQSGIKTVKSFVLGSQYRYSPVSPLYIYGRSQDFALQRARGSINQRLHLRLWLSPMQFEGKPVWVGQVSRDIGVHLAPIFPGTTHKIDPYVDEARDYVLADLIKAGHVDRFAYVKGVGESLEDNPRKNLGGDPYTTNGKRAVVILSPNKKRRPKLLDW